MGKASYGVRGWSCVGLTAATHGDAIGQVGGGRCTSRSLFQTGGGGGGVQNCGRVVRGTHDRADVPPVGPLERCRMAQRCETPSQAGL